MRISAFLLFLCLCVSAAVSGQEINISVKDQSLEKIFSQMEKQSGYTFFYKIELIRTLPKVSVDIRHASLISALEMVLKDQPSLSWAVVNKTVVIKPKTAITMAVPPNQISGLFLVTGKVVNREGQGIPDVSISLKGTQNAWRTAPDGAFKSVVMEGATGPGKPLVLTFSSIGYAAKEVILKGAEQGLFVTLREQVNTLDEIQMTAYSKTSKRYNVGDITTIDAEEIARNPVPNVLQALEGRVPGMQIQTQTGQPNGSFHVQVRSLNTLSAGAASSPNITSNGGQPLYIIDGVEYPADGPLPMAGGAAAVPQYSGYGNALNFLDPSQFESISVLKGPDATSLYGSRGAFGVILITTKKAKGGKPSLNLNVVHGFSNLASHPKLMNSEQYLAMRREAFANNNNATPGASDYDLNGTWDTTKNTNWEHYFLGGHAPTTRMNANYSGGTVNSSYLIGANYSSIGDIQFGKGSVRAGGMNFSMNTSTTDRKFTMGLSGSYSTNVDDMVPLDYSGTSGVLQAPNAPDLRLPNGHLNWKIPGGNPLNALYELYNNTNNTLMANTILTWSPVKGLSFIASGGYSLISSKEFEALPIAYFDPASFDASNTKSLIKWYTIRNYSVDPRVQYEKTLFGKGRLQAIMGATLRDKLVETNGISGSGYSTDELLRDPANAKQANTTATYTNAPIRYFGPFASINFRWADKYILELNGRHDGDSRFGHGHQFGNFGSVAGGWIISEEPWFKPVTGLVDFLKIKGSYGLTGANSLSPYEYISSYNVTTASYEAGLGLTPANLANPYLHWETDKNAEVGMNIGFLREAINIEAIYYFNHMGDQLTNQSLASITGFSSFTYNTPAKIYTHGLELSIVTHNIHKKNFSWDTKINLTVPRSKLTAYPGINNLVSNVNYIVGKPITGIKLYKYAGVDPATGVYNFINAAGVKGEYTPIFSPTQLDANKDRTEFIDLAPKFYGGILNSFSCGNFSMDFLVSVTDKIGPNFEAYQSFPMGVTIQNFPAAYAAKRWKQKGDITTVPKATSNILAFFDQSNFLASTGAYSKATYARLQNLSLTYRFAHGLIQKWRLSGLSVYVAGQNLLTVSKYGDLDPENMSAGRMPPLRTFTGGINVNF